MQLSQSLDDGQYPDVTKESWFRPYSDIPSRYFDYVLPLLLDGSLFHYGNTPEEMHPDAEPVQEHLTALEINWRSVDWISRQEQIIVDTTADPVTKAGFLQRYHWVQDLGINDRIIWVTDDLDLDNIYPNVVAWPRDLACSAYRLQQHYHPEVYPGPRTYFLSCLNRQFRPHRAYLYWLLAQRRYLDQSLVSHRAYVDSYTGDSVDLDHSWFQTIPDDIRVGMSQMCLYRESCPGDNRWINDHSFVHPAYSDSYLNLITESITEPGVYFSEKTFKPLASGQIFLLLGCANSLPHLRNLGLECFDHNLAHHQYDSEQDWICRVDNLVGILDQIYDVIPDIYHINRREIEHNWDWVRSKSFLERCESSLRRQGLIRDS